MDPAQALDTSRDLPIFGRLDIESQSLCNRDCWFCPRTYDRTGTYLDAAGRPVVWRMETAAILDLLDQAAAMGFAGEVAFHYYSEPLLDDRNVTLAREAVGRGMRPYLHTNGDVLARDEALCREVRDVYERIVVGLYDYETADELADLKAWWRSRLGEAKLDFVPIKRAGPAAVPSSGLPRSLVPTDRRMTVPDLTFPNGPCHRPLIRMIIAWDGRMANCCEDVAGAFDLGSIHESTLAELWNSPQHRQVVADLLAGRREDYPLCANCPMSPSGPPPAGEQLRIAPRRYAPGG